MCREITIQLINIHDILQKASTLDRGYAKTNSTTDPRLVRFQRVVQTPSNKTNQWLNLYKRSIYPVLMLIYQGPYIHISQLVLSEVDQTLAYFTGEISQNFRFSEAFPRFQACILLKIKWFGDGEENQRRKKEKKKIWGKYNFCQYQIMKHSKT